MKKLRLPACLFSLIFLFFLNPLKIVAQKDPVSFGEVDIKDVTSKAYDKDLNAEAVILCDYGKTDFQYIENKGFVRIIHRHTRIKVLKTSGINRGTVEVHYFLDKTDNEKISNIKGATYNEKDGKIIKAKLEKEAIFDTKLNEDYGELKFSLPNVKEGSVFEYSYQITSPFGLRPWQFQHDIPIVWSEFRLSIPEYFNYVQISQGFRAFDINERGKQANSINYVERSGNVGQARTTVTPHQVDFQDGSYRWVMKDIPAFKNEKFITTPQDYVCKIDFQLSSTNFPGEGLNNIMGTWDKLKKNLYENEKFGGYLNKRGAIKTLTASLIEGKTNPKEKMNIIYNYIGNTIQYDEAADYIYTSQSAKQLLETKKGSSSEINLLLVMMLKEAGLEVLPILSSTRSHGKVNTTYPMISKFNYVTAYVKIEKEEHVLDATDPMRPVDMVNSFALNGYGLIIDKGADPLWISTQNVTKTSDITICNLNINDEGNINGKIITQHKGYAALRLRRKLIKKEKNTEITSSEADEDNLEIKNNTYKNINEFEKPLEGEAKYETSDFAQVNGDFIYITPMVKFQKKENPLKQEERLFPVDFTYPYEDSYYMTYTIHENYKIEEVPKSMRMQWEDGSVKFEFLAQAMENKVQVVSKLIMNKAVFQPEEYKHLREMFTKLVSKHSEQIVLKKK